MAADLHLDLLGNVAIASPCPARWQDMAGDEKTRHCGRCDLDVHNLIAMTRAEASAVLAGALHGRVCARIWRRADGTIITRDCPVGLAMARRRVLRAAGRVAAALGLATLSAAAARAAENGAWSEWGWAIRLRQTPAIAWVIGHIRPCTPGGAVAGRLVMGDVAAPRTPAPVAGASGPTFGPHPMEHRWAEGLTMRTYTFGFALANTIAAVLVLTTDPAVRADNPWALVFLLTAVTLPACAAWGIAELVHAASPRRCFMPAVRGRTARFVRGLAAGLLGVVLTTAALVLIERPLHELWVTGTCAALASALATFASRRARRGRCPRCSYNLDGLTPASGGLCPECGHDLVPQNPARRAPKSA